MQRAMIALCLAAAAGLSGCSDHPGNRLQNTAEGVYLTSWSGRLFRVSGLEMTPVETVKAGAVPLKTLKIEQTLPDSAQGSFPVSVTGSVKVGGGYRRFKVNLGLAAAGGKDPSFAERSKFAEDLAKGTERLRAITVLFYDSEGYAAGSASIPVDHRWTTVVNDAGQAALLQYSEREKSDPKDDKEIASVVVQWFTGPRRPGAPPYVPDPNLIPDATTPPPAPELDHKPGIG